MILLQTNKIRKAFAADLILSNISIEVQAQERVALVGRNGAGKSTLLKIIAGEITADSGDIIKPKETTVGYLAQNTSLVTDRSIYAEMLSVFQPLINMEKNLRKMEEKMAAPEAFPDKESYQRLLKDYDGLQIAYKESGGYTYQAEIRSVLNGLNFGNYPDDTPITNLSGGQKTRLALGRLLLTKPDLLILDEPTNHLDIDTLTWLENYLLHYPGAILIVSHDRYFLDKVVTKVYEISRTTATKYTGNYTHFLELKAEAFEQELKSYEKQQKEIAKLNEFIQKNIVRASTTKRAQSRRKRLEKMDVLDKPSSDEKSARFSFAINKQSGYDVLSVNHLAIGYQSQDPIMRDLNFALTRGESVALVGPNGIGKSTLLKAIAGASTKLEGYASLGTNVTIGYYDQEQARLTSNKTVLNELWDDFPLKDEKDIRTVLGNFLFSGDDVLKIVSQLSGGEKARLALAKLMMQKDNFLILDEPTNHLDLDSKEILESALIDYPGTILFVSHDRYFINNIAARVIELSTEGLTNYLGDYDYYLEKKEEQAAIDALENKKQEESAPSKPSGGKEQFEKEKERKKRERHMARTIQKLEEDIAELEEAIDRDQAALVDPQVYHDSKKMNEIHQRMTANKEKLDQFVDKWEKNQLEYDHIAMND
ncbi:ATP-binding cassette subfamily F protein 3 [Scopulibacillus darangshiensis]|uniref:ATP-binding cassette subfamily F protein 3 n=1 Tax=Scopulibacillus darangshiensis TaxID=442528 RepID=A0A4R2NEN3_9BACL|nr:ABC-F family ATP-binding cassette domain-containing protein [Scopulibacillus darangshiensis]TCP19723.1 ATP-binding cassette subfamily F protein 3 [Scopulibacillus darangshiensis]